MVPDIREKTTLFADQDVSPPVLLITVWNIVAWYGQGKIEDLAEKTIPVQLCPLQIPRGLFRDLTRASTERSRRLTCLNVSMALKPERTLLDTERLTAYLTHTHTHTNHWNIRGYVYTLIIWLLLYTGVQSHLSRSGKIQPKVFDKRGASTGTRQSCKEELHGSHSSPNVIRLTK